MTATILGFSEKDKARIERERLRIKIDFEAEPHHLDFVLPGLIKGTVGLIVAPGASGKSFWLLQAALSISSGENLAGFQPETAGEVLYVNAEDPQEIVQNRLISMGSLLHKEAREKAIVDTSIIDMRGKMLDITDTAHLESIIKLAYGVRLIIIDTLSRIHTIDENDNGKMSGIVSRLEKVGKETGAAILVAHHTNKMSQVDDFKENQAASRGASSLVDNSRFVCFINKMSEKNCADFTNGFGNSIKKEDAHKYVKYGISKQNYGEPVAGMWFKRGAGGVLLPTILHETGEDKTEVKKGNGYAKATGKGVQDDEEIW
jgi:RecA-family ATPase